MVILPSALISPDPNNAQITLSPDETGLLNSLDLEGYKEGYRTSLPSHPLVTSQTEPWLSGPLRK